MKKSTIILFIVMVMVFESLELNSISNCNCNANSAGIYETISSNHDNDIGPQAAEKEGAKKRVAIGKIVLWTLHAVVLGAGIWYFFVNPKSPLKKKEDTPITPVVKGAYTSVTVRFKSIYKGLNNKVHFGFGIDKKLIQDFNFSVPDIPAQGDGCDQAKLVYDGYVDIVMTKPIFVRRFCQNHYINLSQPIVYCWDWEVKPIAYTYEQGKADPGMPTLLGIDELQFIGDSCAPYESPPDKMIFCDREAWLYFIPPNNP